MTERLRVANCSGFEGDRFSAAREMVTGGPIDVLTGDWLGAATRLVSARERAAGTEGGAAPAFLAQQAEVLGECVDRGIKVVTNAGGLDPAGCAAAVRRLAAEQGLVVSVAHVEGDDLLPRLPELRAAGHDLVNLATGEKLDESGIEPVTAHAHLGAWGIIEALRAGADVVVTGHVTDASLVVGPAAWRFGWDRQDWDELASAVVAGHLLAGGTGVTGGRYPFTAEVPGLERPGFPLAEIDPDGSFVITKHHGTGGRVSIGTATARLLDEVRAVEIVTPDATVRLNSVRLAADGDDRVRVHSVRGLPGSDAAVVAVTYAAGHRNSVRLELVGLDLEAKADLAEQVLWAAIPGGRGRFDRVDVRRRGTHQDGSAGDGDAVADLAVTVVAADLDLVAGDFAAAVDQVLATCPGVLAVSSAARARPVDGLWLTSVPAAVPDHAVVLSDRRLVIPPAPTTPPPLERRVPKAPGSAPVEAGRRPKVAPTVATHPETIAALLDDLGRRRLAAGPADDDSVHWDSVATVRAPLGRLAGARSDATGYDASVAVWTPGPDAYDWLQWYLTVDRFRELLPAETDGLDLDRHELPNVCALAFVLRGLVGPSAADHVLGYQRARALAELLRATVVDLPAEFT